MFAQKAFLRILTIEKRERTTLFGTRVLLSYLVPSVLQAHTRIPRRDRALGPLYFFWSCTDVSAAWSWSLFFDRLLFFFVDWFFFAVRLTWQVSQAFFLKSDHVINRYWLAGFIIVQNNLYVLDLLAMEIDFQCPYDWHKFVIICSLKSNILSTIISTTNRPNFIFHYSVATKLQKFENPKQKLLQPATKNIYWAQIHQDVNFRLFIKVIILMILSHFRLKQCLVWM